MPIEFNKLVRDNIPNIIEKSGETPLYITLDDKEFALELRKKLSEEVQEFLENNAAEELADILEVVYALADLQGHRPEQLEALRQQKRQMRGGFENRYFLLSKSDPEDQL